MEEPKKDGKAWVRQWVALMMCVYVITLGIIAFMTKADVGEYMKFTSVAYTYIGWFFTSREIEKIKRR